MGDGRVGTGSRGVGSPGLINLLPICPPPRLIRFDFISSPAVLGGGKLFEEPAGLGGTGILLTLRYSVLSFAIALLDEVVVQYFGGFRVTIIRFFWAE